jgi:hypothetical protein
MKRIALAIFATFAVCACVSLTAGGAKVTVYETDRSAGQPAALPQGCRLLASEGPIDLQERERLVDDPYRVQRNRTAERGGNVLLLRSSVLKDLPKTDCAPSDRSVDCQQGVGTWYRVSFESYACDEPARQRLAAASAQEQKTAWWWPFGSKKKDAAASAAEPAASPAVQTPKATVSQGLAAADLKARVLTLAAEGVGTDVILAYVRANRLARPLTAEEILDWKRSGIGDDVIRATFPD